MCFIEEYELPLLKISAGERTYFQFEVDDIDDVSLAETWSFSAQEFCNRGAELLQKTGDVTYDESDSSTVGHILIDFDDDETEGMEGKFIYYLKIEGDDGAILAKKGILYITFGGDVSE